MTDIEILRDVEIDWLAFELGESIANLAYPVGMGAAPKPEQLRNAATKLFDRYMRMIELAAKNGKKPKVKR